MFAWFQRLLPRQGNFFELFESHPATLVAGANALSRMLQGGEGRADHVQEIIEREHDADEIPRERLQTVRRPYLTPFDRRAISYLVPSMAETINAMKQTTRPALPNQCTPFTTQQPKNP